MISILHFGRNTDPWLFTSINQPQNVKDYSHCNKLQGRSINSYIRSVEWHLNDWYFLNVQYAETVANLDTLYSQ